MESCDCEGVRAVTEFICRPYVVQIAGGDVLVR